jgi:excisionase family DNA binding protein
MPIEKRWLTAVETAAYMNLNVKSVYRACRARKLPYAKVPGVGVRIDKRALDALFEQESISPRDHGKRIEQ